MPTIVRLSVSTGHVGFKTQVKSLFVQRKNLLTRVENNIYCFREAMGNPVRSAHGRISLLAIPVM